MRAQQVQPVGAISLWLFVRHPSGTPALHGGGGVPGLLSISLDRIPALCAVAPRTKSDDQKSLRVAIKEGSAETPASLVRCCFNCCPGILTSFGTTERKISPFII